MDHETLTWKDWKRGPIGMRDREFMRRLHNPIGITKIVIENDNRSIYKSRLQIFERLRRRLVDIKIDMCKRDVANFCRPGAFWKIASYPTHVPSFIGPSRFDLFKTGV